jgi:hypothetical protein
VKTVVYKEGYNLAAVSCMIGSGHKNGSDQIGNHKPFMYKTLRRILKFGHTNLMGTVWVHTIVIILMESFVWLSCDISS